MHYEYVYKTNKFESKNYRRTRKSIKGIVFVILIIIVGYYFSGLVLQVFRNKNTVTVVSPLAEPVNASIDTIKEAINPSKLPDVVKEVLSGAEGNYAVYIKNLKTNEIYAVNENRSFYSASLYKLWVMATTFKIIESGKLSPDYVLDKSIKELNKKFDISSESAELTTGQFTMEVKNAITQMITISHNYAALALSDRIGISNISRFLKNINLANSKVGNTPITTASDIGRFYEMLYKGELGNSSSTLKMLETLKAQKLNDRIPKYLPEGTEIAHKTGELGLVKHDAGIVFAPFGDYIIVILSETPNQQIAAEREALLSKAVYEYFEAKAE